jgi:sugar lactone lactonase YvrE
MKTFASIFTACLLASTASFAAERKAEPVVDMNKIVYDVKDPALAKAWNDSKIFEKVMAQGAKIDSKGQFYISTARWAGKEMPATLSRLVKQGDAWLLVPFPSEEMNNPDNPKGLKSVLGFEIDRNDVMWILDQGKIAGGATKPGDEKIVLWDLKTNKELQRYEFSNEESDHKCSFLNDVAVDNDTGFAYIPDSGIFCDPTAGGIIVYDSKANKARRVLDRTQFTVADPNFFFNMFSDPVNKPVTTAGPMKTGPDGVALSGDKKTLYWTNLTGNKLYALDTSLLKDFATPEPVLQSAVKEVAVLPSNTDGMTADRDGNVYATALTLDGLMKIDPRRNTVERFVHDPAMVWPDTLTWGADGSLYVISDHLNQFVDGTMNFKDPAVPNFRIWKIPNVGTPYTAK